MAFNQDNNVSINTQALEDCANKIRAKNGLLKQALEDIERTVDTLVGGAYISDAATAIEGKMRTFKTNNFEKFYNAVEAFGTALITTKERYETAESSLEQNANQKNVSTIQFNDD